MRRVIGLILAGSGTFLIVVGVSCHLGQQPGHQVPAERVETATLAASNASYFSPSGWPR